MITMIRSHSAIIPVDPFQKSTKWDENTVIFYMYRVIFVHTFYRTEVGMGTSD